MIANIHAMSVRGLETQTVEVEVDINPGLPSFTIVGLPDVGVQESKERLRSALKSVGTPLPMQRITINLAPAHLKKSGPSFDLPIAVGILQNMDVLQHSEILETSLFLGELALDGKLRSVSGVLPITLAAKQKGYKKIFLPAGNAREASIVSGIDIIPLHSLTQLIEGLNYDRPLPVSDTYDFHKHITATNHSYDFADIIGQQHAKRALEIAAAGGHNIILSGPPGSGKTLLAKTFASILPAMTADESVHVSQIYSVTGQLSDEHPLITKRPFRSIHHTASAVSIIGGGRQAMPGEISLAHTGVLFLDEILEFPKPVLEVLRQPLEDGYIHVNRVNASSKYPAQFTLIGAMNPCPCGYLNDPDRDCVCSDVQIQNYRSKLSGPLMDRIDMFVEVPKVEVEAFQKSHISSQSSSSAVIYDRVQAARERQTNRFSSHNFECNSDISSKYIHSFCVLDTPTSDILRHAVKRLDLSARAYYRILKLARTIADLEGKNNIEKHHVLEALSFRAT